MSNKPTNPSHIPDEIGKAHPTDADLDLHPSKSEGAKPGTERARDEQRDDGGPRYGGGEWKVADERGDKRFGNARNDDADPSELAKGTAPVDDDEWPGGDSSPQSNDEGEDTEEDKTSASDETDTASESSGQRTGMSRGDKPLKAKKRGKNGARS